ncbi:CHAD domain-containing protein [Rhabdaerophilum calidifontis]|uniref:CHAD domain-containing protein n=1 Tax=Rhabdaerophilum calidifontis TaxID=2604328 RepID=UPI00140D3525|nr:CHAD domain-containing protein [Rhabdaerophilum calidifontis]
MTVGIIAPDTMTMNAAAPAPANAARPRGRTRSPPKPKPAKALLRAPPPALRRHEDIARGLVRLLKTEIAAARALLAAQAAQSTPLVIHAARRRLKRARAIVRLLRPVPEADAPALAAMLRDASKALAGARDASVLAETAETLARRIARPAEEALLASIADHARMEAARLGQAGPGPGRAARRLRAAERHVGARLAVPGRPAPPSALILPRLATIYRRARKGWRRAQAAPDAETLHEWRRRVQDRLHLARIFARRWPERKPPRESRLDRLSEVLGRDHDLAVLAARIPADHAAAPAIQAAIADRHRQLARKALKLGGTLFGGKSGPRRRAWLALDRTAPGQEAPVMEVTQPA